MKNALVFLKITFYAAKAETRSCTGASRMRNLVAASMKERGRGVLPVCRRVHRHQSAALDGLHSAPHTPSLSLYAQPARADDVVLPACRGLMN